MASVKQVQVTFDCANPRAVAEFWKAVLGYIDPPVPPGSGSWDAFDASLPVERQGSTWVCQVPDGVGPRLFAGHFLRDEQTPFHDCAISRRHSFAGGAATVIALGTCCTVETGGGGTAQPARAS